MNFYETPAGQMFFEHQMPQIIKSLQSLSEALNRKNPVVKLFLIMLRRRQRLITRW